MGPKLPWQVRLAIWELSPWRVELKGVPEFSVVCAERRPRASVCTVAGIEAAESLRMHLADAQKARPDDEDRHACRSRNRALGLGIGGMDGVRSLRACPARKYKPILRCADVSASQSCVLGGEVGTCPSKSPQATWCHVVPLLAPICRLCGHQSPISNLALSSCARLASPLWMPLVRAVFLIYSSSLSFIVFFSLSPWSSDLSCIGSQSLHMFLLPFLVCEPVQAPGPNGGS